MPHMPVKTVRGMKIVAMIVNTFITAFSWFDTADRCASSRLVIRSWKKQRLVGQPHQVIVDVTKPVGDLLGNQGELSPRQPSHGVALRQHDPPQRGHVPS